MRDDLLLEVKRLAEEDRFDYLVIESTGISEPMPVAETFTFVDENNRALSEVAQLDTMVTVVDAYHFLDEDHFTVLTHEVNDKGFAFLGKRYRQWLRKSVR